MIVYRNNHNNPDEFGTFHHYSSTTTDLCIITIIYLFKLLCILLSLPPFTNHLLKTII